MASAQHLLTSMPGQVGKRKHTSTAFLEAEKQVLGLGTVPNLAARTVTELSRGGSGPHVHPLKPLFWKDPSHPSLPPAAPPGFWREEQAGARGSGSHGRHPLWAWLEAFYNYVTLASTRGPTSSMEVTPFTGQN